MEIPDNNNIREINEKLISELIVIAREQKQKFSLELVRDEIGQTGFHVLKNYAIVYPDGSVLFTTFQPIET